MAHAFYHWFGGRRLGGEANDRHRNTSDLPVYALAYECSDDYESQKDIIQRGARIRHIQS